MSTIIKIEAQISSLDLIQAVEQSLPQELEELYLNLIEKRDQETLTNAEYDKLLELTETVEKHEVQRLEYLIQLANIRQISLTDLITQMGEHPPL